MPVGTYGKIKVLALPSGAFDARTRFRDYDGTTRQVRAAGRSVAAAERALKAKIRDRQGPAGTIITSQTRLRDLADSWLAASHSPEWSTGTRDTYTYVVKNNVKPALGDLRIAEAKVAVLNRAIDVIKARSGLGAAKTTKTVLSGMFKHAITHEACEVNPVRDATSVPRKKSRAQALTVQQTDEITDRLRSSQSAVDYDLPDLVDWMLYTGCRIGEACAAREETNLDGEPLLDYEHGTWEVNATVIRIKGEGLIIQERTKSEAGWRILALPPGALAMLQRRKTELRLKAPRSVVFGASSARALRDPRNTNRELRKALDKIGYTWVTSHTFRKTVGTRLDDAGLSARLIADQLGHARPSMTQDVYMGRNVVNAAAAVLLDR
jgi:integrase